MIFYKNWYCNQLALSRMVGDVCVFELIKSDNVVL